MVQNFSRTYNFHVFFLRAKYDDLGINPNEFELHVFGQKWPISSKFTFFGQFSANFVYLVILKKIKTFRFNERKTLPNDFVTLVNTREQSKIYSEQFQLRANEILNWSRRNITYKNINPRWENLEAQSKISAGKFCPEIYRTGILWTKRSYRSSRWTVQTMERTARFSSERTLDPEQECSLTHFLLLKKFQNSNLVTSCEHKPI